MRVPVSLGSALLLAMLSLPLAAQSVISAKSGTLHHMVGQLTVDGTPLRADVAYFPLLKPGSTLRTGQGRAEILLTPGVFLRIIDHTAVKMLDSDLAHTRVELLEGEAMLEADDPQISVKNAPVTLVFGETELRIVKHGLVGIRLAANELKVYRGEAEIVAGATKLSLRQGHFTSLKGELKSEKFDVNAEGSELMAWSQERSAALSAANLYTAAALRSSRTYGTADGAWNGSGWYYNSFFDTFTYIPGRGTMWNPWGYGYYSPFTIFGANGISQDWYRSVAINQPSGTASNINSGATAVDGVANNVRRIGIRPPNGGRLSGAGAAAAAAPGSDARNAFTQAAVRVAEERRSNWSGNGRTGALSGESGGGYRGNASQSGGSFGGGAASSGSLAGGSPMGGGGAHMGGGGGGATRAGGGGAATERRAQQ